MNIVYWIAMTGSWLALENTSFVCLSEDSRLYFFLKDFGCFHLQCAGHHSSNANISFNILMNHLVYVEFAYCVIITIGANLFLLSIIAVNLKIDYYNQYVSMKFVIKKYSFLVTNRL